MTRPPRCLVSFTREADPSGITYGSSSGSMRSRSGSPVEEMPAACVMVVKPAPRARMARSTDQSRMNPADGASNATGCEAMLVHVSHIASGAGMCEY